MKYQFLVLVLLMSGAGALKADAVVTDCVSIPGFESGPSYKIVPGGSCIVPWTDLQPHITVPRAKEQFLSGSEIVIYKNPGKILARSKYDADKHGLLVTFNKLNTRQSQSRRKLKDILLSFLGDEFPALITFKSSVE